MQPPAIHVPSLFKPSPACIPVIDPELKHLGRVWLPTKHVEHTAGVERWARRDAHPPSLCILFQAGRCNAGGQCNQIHADPAHVEAIRSAVRLLPRNNCCFTHGDVPSQREDFRRLLEEHGLELTCPGAEPLPIPVEWVAMTMFWDRFLRTKRGQKARPAGAFRFSTQRVCKLHQRSACKYGVDCNSVHLCREFWARIRDLISAPPVTIDGAPPPAPIGPPTPPTRMVQEQLLVHQPYGEVAAPWEAGRLDLAIPEGAATSSTFMLYTPVPEPPRNRPLPPTRESKLPASPPPSQPAPPPAGGKLWAPPGQSPSPPLAGAPLGPLGMAQLSPGTYFPVRQSLSAPIPMTSPPLPVCEFAPHPPGMPPPLPSPAVAANPVAGPQYPTTPTPPIRSGPPRVSLPAQPHTASDRRVSLVPPCEQYSQPPAVVFGQPGPNQSFPYPPPRVMTPQRPLPYSFTPSDAPGPWAEAPSGDAGYRAPPRGRLNSVLAPSVPDRSLPAPPLPSGTMGPLAPAPLAAPGSHETLTSLMNRVGASLSHPPPRGPFYAVNPTFMPAPNPGHGAQ